MSVAVGEKEPPPSAREPWAASPIGAQFSYITTRTRRQAATRITSVPRRHRASRRARCPPRGKVRIAGRPRQTRLTPAGRRHGRLQMLLVPDQIRLGEPGAEVSVDVAG